MPSSTIGERLKALLQAKNWTVAYAAEKTGVSESTIGRILNNRCNTISPTTLRLLAEGLEVALPDLTGEETPVKAPTDLEAALVAQQEGWERLVDHLNTSKSEALKLLNENCEHRIQNEKRRTIRWMAAAIAALALLSAVSAAYYRFYWDVTNPTKGSIQYETIDELREALGIEAPEGVE